MNELFLLLSFSTSTFLPLLCLLCAVCRGPLYHSCIFCPFIHKRLPAMPSWRFPAAKALRCAALQLSLTVHGRLLFARHSSDPSFMSSPLSGRDLFQKFNVSTWSNYYIKLLIENLNMISSNNPADLAMHLHMTNTAVASRHLLPVYNKWRSWWVAH